MVYVRCQCITACINYSLSAIFINFRGNPLSLLMFWEIPHCPTLGCSSALMRTVQLGSPSPGLLFSARQRWHREMCLSPSCPLSCAGWCQEPVQDCRCESFPVVAGSQWHQWDPPHLGWKSTKYNQLSKVLPIEWQCTRYLSKSYYHATYWGNSVLVLGDQAKFIPERSEGTPKKWARYSRHIFSSIKKSLYINCTPPPPLPSLLYLLELTLLSSR